MTDHPKPPKDRTYEVGFGKPPRQFQFVPGQSGFKGRKKKKKSETQAEIIARVRDQTLTVQGKEMSMFELSIMAVFNQTMKSGKARDMKMMFELLDRYGAIPDVDRQAEMEADAAEAMNRIDLVINRTLNIDPADVAALDRLEVEEADLIMGCPNCSPRLHARWKEPEYKALVQRHGATSLHKQVRDAKDPCAMLRHRRKGSTGA